jgi:hypothetical protein
MKYVQRVINYLNERLFNLFMFNACKLFIPILYPTYPNDKTCSIEQWLDKLCGKFQVPMMNVTYIKWMFWNGSNHVEDNTQEVFMGGMGLWKHYYCVVNKSD